ncbi:MAG: adenylate/guanylate cyclase domain-containing protein [Acidimicrobiia bacterium]
MSIPDFRFAEASDGVRIAYQRFGQGAPTIVVGEVFNHLAVRWELPLFRRAFEFLGEHLDTVTYDQRGCGMSDRAEGAMTVADRMKDLDAIIQAENLESVNLIGSGDGAIVAVAYAAAQPHRVNKLVISNGRIDVSSDELAWSLGSHPKGWTREEVNSPGLGSWNWGSDVADFVAFTTPSLADDPSITQWWLRFQRVTLSRDEMMKQAEAAATLDLAGSASDVVAPTLVTHTVGNRAYHLGHARAWATLIPGAVLEEIPGEDHIVELAPYWREIYGRHVEFLSGSQPDSRAVRGYAAVLFTDIVESTSQSLAAGDQRWTARLDSHDRIVSDAVTSHGGRLVKLTGDGVVATFETPSAAIDAAVELQAVLDAAGIQVRAGMHAGEIEIRGEDVTGSVVNLAARTMAEASAGELYVTGSVKDQLLGSRFEFQDRGEHTLKGFATSRRLFLAAHSMSPA